MSSASFNATIDLSPRPSVRALTALFVLHAAALVLLMLALRPGPAMAGLAAAMALSWLWTRRHPLFGFGRRALARLTWHTEGGWTLHEASGQKHEAELLGNSLVHPRLMVLNFRLEDGGRRSRALLGDELEPELMRRLRARLKAESPLH
jgi:toxin CptA